MPSQNTLPATTAQVSRVLYLTCMKNSTTSVALRTAIDMATIDVERTEIDERDRDGDSRAHHQREEDRVVGASRDDVARHGISE